MTRADATFGPLVRAIIADDRSAVSHLLETSPEMARARLESGATRAQAADYFVDELGHYLYAGDTPLHVTAVAYRAWLVPILVAAGAEVAAGNRRGAQPLHYAADGGPGSRRWAPATQRDTVLRLIAAGADPNAVDLGGVTPLHRAVRNRCADAVSALLEGGADPGRPNKRGSTPMQLALTASGRGNRPRSCAC
jgi:ankyrin repeat protein